VNVPTDLPIACTLTPGEAVERLAEWRELAGSLLERKSTEGGARLVFRASAGPQLEKLVAAERECCPFLEFKIQPSGATFELEVTGPQEARPTIERLTV
jgi:hypothetical protein